MSGLENRAGGWFPETRWSTVLTASRPGIDAGPALESFCRIYWKPVWMYIRAQGFSPEEAEDLTQDFFDRLIRREWLADVEQEKGRLRTFLAVVLKRYLINAREYQGAVRRGGRLRRVDSDIAECEARFLEAPDLSPDRMFDRHWVLALLEVVLEKLRREWEQGCRRTLFDTLRPALAHDGDDWDCRAAAKSLGMSEGNIRVALHRLRARYRDLLIDEVSRTLGQPAAAGEELRQLLALI